MLSYLIGGLVLGGLYAIASLGLVIAYRSSHVFNFAFSSMAYAVAVCHYEFVVLHGWPALLSAAICILVIAPLLGVMLSFLVFRHLRHTAVSVQVVATIGLFVAIPAAIRVLFGQESRLGPIGLWDGERPVYSFFSATINRDQLTVIVAAALLAVGLTLVLRFTEFGLAMRAVVDNSNLGGLVGINPKAVDLGAGALSAGAAGLAGVLMAPVLGLTEANFELLLIASIAAVVVGGLRSLPWTFVGAISLGLVQGIAGKYIPNSGILARGLRPSIPFFVIFGVLAGYSLWLTIRREPLAAPPAGTGLSGHAERRGGKVYRWTVTAIFSLLVLAFPMLLSGAWTDVISYGIALGVVLLSYVLIAGEGQIVSLCQVTLAGVGAIVTAQMSTEFGWPFIPSLLVGGLVAMPIGAAIALATLRLGALYLALGTLGAAMLFESLVFPISRFDNLSLGVEVDRPTLFGIDLGTDIRFFYFCLAAFVLMALLVANLRHSTSGLGLGAMRSAEPAAAMLGVNVLGMKVMLFTLSAFIAGVGGGLLASSTGRAVPVAFTAVAGLVWLAALVTFGVKRLWAALVGGIVVAAVPRLFNRYVSIDFAELPSVLFGLGAIAVARDPGGAISGINEGLLRLGDKLRTLGGEPSTAPSATPGPAGETVDVSATQDSGTSGSSATTNSVDEPIS